MPSISKTTLISISLLTTLFTGCSTTMQNNNQLQLKTQQEIQEALKNRFYQKGYKAGYEAGYEKSANTLKQNILTYKTQLQATNQAKKAIANGNVNLQMYKQKLPDGSYKIVYKINELNPNILNDITAIPTLNKANIPNPKPLNKEELELYANSSSTFDINNQITPSLTKQANKVRYLYIPNKEFYINKLSKSQYIYQIQSDKIKIVFDNLPQAITFCKKIGLNYTNPNICE